MVFIKVVFFGVSKKASQLGIPNGTQRFKLTLFYTVHIRPLMYTHILNDIQLGTHDLTLELKIENKWKFLYLVAREFVG